MALIETWFVKNNSYAPISITDIMSPYTVAPNQEIDLLSAAVGSNTAESIANSIIIRNSNLLIVSSGVNAGKRYLDSDYLHSHDEFSLTSHTHTGLDVLTDGPTSDADSLHTHDGLTTVTEVSDLIDAALVGGIDLSGYVTKAGSINQLSDITSTGSVIESAVSKAHDESHTLLEHLDDGVVTTVKLITLMDGSNADCCHTHSFQVHNDLTGLDGGVDSQYYHLTLSQHDTLTDGSNADALHTHSGTGGVSIHNDLDQLQGGDISNDEMYHLTFDQTDIVSRFGEDSSGLTFDGEPIGSGGGGVSVHNSLLGLQGGDVDEYYHVTYEEFDLLTNGKAADSLHTHYHNLLTGIQGGDPSNDEVYHLTLDQVDIVVRLDEDSSGLTFDGEPIGGGGSSTCAYGTVYINDITPTGGGNVGDKVYLSGSNDEVLISCSADDLNIRVYVIAMIGPSNLRPSVTVNGTAVGNWDYAAYASDNRVLFRGYADFLLVGTTVTATHEDGATDSCIVAPDTAPVISSVSFTGAYPGLQIEYKAVDDVGMTVTADIVFDQVEVENSGACDYQLVTSFGEVTTHAWTAEIADRGDTRVSYPARVRVRKPSGTWSAWVYTNASASVDHTDEIYLNNLYPTVGTMNQGSITYPGAQEAIKGTETVDITCACSDFDTITYSDPTGNELTIPNTSTYQSPKLNVAGASSGNYNISSTNYRVSCNRTNNDATTTKNLVVYVADLPLTVTMSEASRLRTGGNDGTAAQNHTITMTCNQRVLSTATPTIAAASANGGTWSGSFSGGPTTFTRTLVVDESASDAVGTYNYNALSVYNLANTETTSYTGDSQYVIGGFVTRDITLAAFGNEATFNAAVVTYGKCTLLWSFKTLTIKDSYNSTTAPQAFAWCFAGTLDVSPTTARVLDTAATASSSNATTLTVEESI